MKAFIGAAITLAIIAIPAYVVWRLVRGVEGWFVSSGAGDVLMWSLIAALVLAVFAIPVGAWGLAARLWVVRMRDDEYLVSTAHVLLEQPRPAQQVNVLPVSETQKRLEA